MEKDVEGVEWHSYPVRENRKKALLAVFFLLFFWSSIYFTLGLFWLLISLLLLGGSVLPFFTVTRYKLDGEGVTVKKPFYTIRRGWGHFRSYYPDGNGILLSPFSEPSRLENFRGLYIRYPIQEDQKEKILKFLMKMVDS